MSPASDNHRELAEPRCLEDQELAAVWEGLELAPPDPAPLGYVDRVVAHCRATESVPVPLSPWTRAVAGVALVLGAWLGQGLAVGPLMPAPVTPAPVSSTPGTPVVTTEGGPAVAELGATAALVNPALGPMVPSLAEVYWSLESDVFGEAAAPRETEERR